MSNTVSFGRYSMLVGKKQDNDWYEWCVFVDEKPEVLQRIKSVEYTLHPSFPNPIRRVLDESSRFALFSSGWGGFDIAIDVEWKDDSQTKTIFPLRLAANAWPTKSPPQAYKNVEEAAVYKALFNEKFRWRKAETIAKGAGISEDRVAEVLSDLERRNFVRRSYFQSFEKKDLWAPTLVVGIAPELERD